MQFGGLIALDKLDFDIAVGETVGLVGPNGSGKTTFFNVLTGLYCPSAGSIKIDSNDLYRQSPQTISQAGSHVLFSIAA